MELYDDIDTKPRTSQIDGWSSGIKMLQAQLAVKKAQLPKERKDKKTLLTPTINLRPKLPQSVVDRTAIARNSEMITTTTTTNLTTIQKPIIITSKPLEPILDENIRKDDWDFIDEYDPLWPCDYEKLKEKSHNEKNRDDRRSNNRHDDRDRKRRRRNSHNDSPPIKYTGFPQRHIVDDDMFSSPSNNLNKGVTIAPPPSLQEISISNDNGDSSSNVTIPYSASSVAAKIMARYGFKDGQGLGKQEQGMSIALQVEKTSKRGGRIIHEKELFLPPPSLSPPPAMIPPIAPIATPTPIPPTNKEMPPPIAIPAPPVNAEPSITEIMKAPSKVVLLKNMVGPGDVDEELEPEVKDECNTKYGEVTSVIIKEDFGTTPEEAIKIFVEFKRIESAIKAVVDLNGRFFGGRQVRAAFYNFDKFKAQIYN